MIKEIENNLHIEIMKFLTIYDELENESLSMVFKIKYIEKMSISSISKITSYSLRTINRRIFKIKKLIKIINSKFFS